MSIEAIIRTKGREVATIGPDASVVDAAEVLKEQRIGVVVVCSPEGHVFGMISERDIIHAVADWPKKINTLRVSQLYTEHPVTCSLEDDEREVLEKMHKMNFRHIPVVENGKLAGIVSSGDLLAYLLGEANFREKEFFWSQLEFL